MFFKHLNINSMKDKFEISSGNLSKYVWHFLDCENKVDFSFPNQQFSIPECQTFRKDRNAHGGGLLYCVNQDLNCKLPWPPTETF